MLKQRLLAALFLIPLVLIVLFILPLPLFMLVVLLVCVLAAWEWAPMAGFVRRTARLWFTLATCGVLLLMQLSIPAYQTLLQTWHVTATLWLALGWWALAMILVLFYPRSAHWWRDCRLVKALFGLCVLVPFFWGMMILRQYHYSVNHHIGAWWLLYVMVLVWAADSGAYFAGRHWGKHKLAPQVSPGKTWEGLLGGLVLAVLVAWLFNHLVLLHSSPKIVTFSAIIAVIASVFGDLTESMLKREAGIKDSGQLIPGHGGILDRIDSLTAAIPIFACLLFLVFKTV